MAKAIKSITVRWKWKGDKYAIKGFNLAVCQSGKTPLESQTAFANTNAEHKTIDADGDKNYEYIFKDITLEVGATYNTWVQAIYEGKDSEWVNTSGSAVSDDGKDSIPSIIPTSFKYIRSWLNGNSVNTGNHWMEIQVFNKNGENVALEKDVTSSATISNISKITDGFISDKDGTTNSQYASGGSGWTWVKIDLGAIYTDITRVSIWHYYDDNREYNSKLEVSKDGNTWIELFNSEIQGRYKETVKGKTYIIDAAYINDKLNAGDTIDDINNSPGGKIEYAKLNIKGAISFDDLDDTTGAIYDVERHPDGSVKQTFINGASIKTGSIEAEKVKMYNLNVVRRKKDENNIWQELDTSFSVSEEGHIKASGTFSSFNYRPDNGSDISTSKGWMISENGDSIFNNTIVRGRVELPSAGITDHDNSNMMPNTDFNINDNIKHWSIWGSNGKITRHTPNNEDAYLNYRNITLDVADGGVGLVTPRISQGLESNTYYTLSFKARSASNTEILDYIYLLSNEDGISNSKIIDSIKINTYDTWKTTQSITFRTSRTYTNPSFLIGFTDAVITGNTNTKGFAIKNIKLEKGEFNTTWCPAETGPVRFYSGSTFDNRTNAPFRVLQDGSLYATKGTFQGTFTGNLEIGNISIKDTVGTSDTPSLGVIEIKDDTNTNSIIRIGEDYSQFNSNVFFGEKDNHFMMSNKDTRELVFEGTGGIRLNYFGPDEFYQHYDPDNPDPDMFFNSTMIINGSKIEFDNKMNIRANLSEKMTIGSRKAYSLVELKSDFSGEEDGSGPGKIDLSVAGNISTTEGISIGKAVLKAVYSGSAGSGVDIFVQ